MESGIKNLVISDPKELLENLNVYGVPDITKVVKDCGFNLYLSKIKPVNMRGFVSVDDYSDKEKLIVLRNSLTFTTQRFLIAYLFSSYQLNSESNGKYISILYDETIYDKKVYNYALDLLMPDFIFDDDYKKYDLSFLAQKYNVSEFLIDEKVKRKEKKII